MSKKPHPAVAQGRMWNAIAKKGYRALTRSDRPVITWRKSVCRHRLLTVYLTPDGWQVDGDDFKIGMPEWLDLLSKQSGLDLTLDDYRAGKFAAFNPGEVEGVKGALDLDHTRWPAEKNLYLGCKDWAGLVPLGLLAEDAGRFRETRRCVDRVISPIDA